MSDPVWVAIEHNSGGAAVVGVFESLELAEETVLKPGHVLTKVFESPAHVTWSRPDRALHVSFYRHHVQVSEVEDAE